MEAGRKEGSKSKDRRKKRRKGGVKPKIWMWRMKRKGKKDRRKE